MKTNRRQFVGHSLTLLGSLGLVSPSPAGPAPAKTYRAAVIGRTGRGDYGHGYDRIFAGLENVKVEAIADQDPAGLQAAAERSGAKRSYLDHREMLQKEKPDLVSIAPRQPDCHKEMALAAIEVGANIFVEKPFTETPADADAILAAAERKGVKIMVAHNRRYTAEFVKVKALLAEGFVGQIREVRCRGKQDARVGGEDMIVLGTHDFDLFRSWFGDPLWCQASVTADGRDITARDVRKGQEPILVAGDTVHALFAFPNRVMVYWSSVKTTDSWNTSSSQRGRWSWEIYGTRRIVAQQDGLGFIYLDSPFVGHRDETGRWQDLPAPAQFDWPEHARHPIRSLIHAVETGGQPVCSGHDGRWTIEMVAAVYESQRTKRRVALPLGDRGNPLLRFD